MKKFKKTIFKNFYIKENKDYSFKNILKNMFLGSSPILAYGFYSYYKDLENCKKDLDCIKRVKEKYKELFFPLSYASILTGSLTAITAPKIKSIFNNLQK